MVELRTLQDSARVRRDERVVDRVPWAVSSGRQRVSAELAAARRGEGQTVFDVLVEIIRDHGPGGAQEEDGVLLELA